MKVTMKDAAATAAASLLPFLPSTLEDASDGKIATEDLASGCIWLHLVAGGCRCRECETALSVDCHRSVLDSTRNLFYFTVFRYV